MNNAHAITDAFISYNSKYHTKKFKKNEKVEQNGIEWIYMIENMKVFLADQIIKEKAILIFEDQKK